MQERFGEPPSILIFDVNNSSQIWASQTGSNVFEIPATLDMARYMANSSQRCSEVWYQLHVLISFSINSTSKVYVRELGTWYQYADSGKIRVDDLLSRDQDLQFVLVYLPLPARLNNATAVQQQVRRQYCDGCNHQHIQSVVHICSIYAQFTACQSLPHVLKARAYNALHSACDNNITET